MKEYRVSAGTCQPDSPGRPCLRGPPPRESLETPEPSEEAILRAPPILTTLGTILGLQALRAFFPLLVYVMRDRFGLSPIALAGIGFGVFGTALLMPRLLANRDPVRGLAAAAVLLAVTRGTFQIGAGDPLVSLVIGTISVIAFLGFVAALSRDRDLPRVPFLVGLLLDAVIHAAAGTRDLHWGGPFSDLATWVLVAPTLFLALKTLRVSPEDETGLEPRVWSHGVGLLAWGPFLFLHLEWLGNVARLSARAATPTGVSGAILAAGLALGVLLARHLPRQGFWAGAPVILLAATFFGRGLVWSGATGVLAAPTLLVAQLAGITLFARCFAGGAPWPRTTSETVSFGGGALLFFALLFGHYGGYVLPLPFSRTALLLVAAGVLLVVTIAARSTNDGRAAPRFSFAGTALLAVVALAPLARPMLAQGLSRDPPLEQSSSGYRAPIKVVTFNLHVGFDERGGFAYDGMLRALRATNADLIGLQEVSRGWVINGSADLYELAREALGMTGVPGPSTDFDWGNALFTRWEPDTASIHPMPPEDLLLERSVIVMTLSGEERSAPKLQVLATHYHHREDGPEIRSAHSRFLVSLAGAESRSTPSILLGDFNSVPDSEPMAILARAGWRDVFAPEDEENLTWIASDPVRRIDTILARGPLHLERAEVAPPWGSDHRAVIAEFYPAEKMER